MRCRERGPITTQYRQYSDLRNPSFSSSMLPLLTPVSPLPHPGLFAPRPGLVPKFHLKDCQLAHPPKRPAHPRSPMPRPLSTLTARATHARLLLPAALASVPYSIWVCIIILVRVRVEVCIISSSSWALPFGRPALGGIGLISPREAQPVKARAHWNTEEGGGKAVGEQQQRKEDKKGGQREEAAEPGCPA